MSEPYEYGPFTDGYVASTDRTKIGPRALGEDSLDVYIDPVTGAACRRGGSATVFDASAVGLLEAKWGARARQPLALESPSLTDGQPTLACLFSDDADKEAQLWWWSTNGSGTQQVIGKSYGTTHRSNAASTPWHFLMIPLWTQHATQTFTRCATELARRVIMAGSRSVLRTGNGVIAPCRLGTPVIWNGKFNDGTAVGTDQEYVRPLGPIGPVFPVRRSGVPAASTGAAWKGAEAAYYAVVHEFADGSRSIPYLGGSAITGGGNNGLITIDSANPTNHYTYVTLIVPPGPPDCVARIICRTNKWDTSAASYTIEDPTALFVCGVLRNNTQTLYNDYVGNDADLRDRPDVVDFARAMPPAGRHVGTMDGRVVFGDLSPNPSAIQLAPYAYNATMLDTYTVDDTGAYGTVEHFFFFDGTNIKLKYTSPPAAATTAQTIAIAGKTLQTVIDEINAVPATAGNYPWRAQLAPGVDGNALAADLQPMNGADYFDDDTICNDGTTGNQRVLNGQGLPGMLYFKATAAWITKGIDRQALHFTTGNPAATNTETDAPIAASNWKGGYDCRRRVDSRYGRIMGIGQLLDGCLVGMTRGIVVGRNIRGGKTGADTDYRFEPWKGLTGCIAWGGSGDGWVVYMTQKGLMVNDGKREVCISQRVWSRRGSRGAGRGPWQYEVGKCIAGVAADDDSAMFGISVVRGAIYVQYRSSSSVSYPDRQMVYDFSASLNEVGVDQVLRPDGSPFPWSAPYRLRVSLVASVMKSDGEHIYGMVEDNAGSTGNGRADEIELSSSQADNGSTVVPLVYLETSDFGELRRKKRVTRVDLEYYDDAGEGSVSASMTYARSDLTALKSTLSAVTDGTISARARMRIPAALRKPCDVFEIKVTDAAAAATRFEVHRATAWFKRLNTAA